MKESVMSVNNFNEPRVYDKREAIALMLLRLLLLEPGTNNTHPDMGIGIVSKYRYSTEDNLDDLNTNIKNQIATYLPELIVQNIELSLQRKILHIIIQVNEEFYSFDLDTDKKELTISELSNN